MEEYKETEEEKNKKLKDLQKVLDSNSEMPKPINRAERRALIKKNKKKR